VTRGAADSQGRVAPAEPPKIIVAAASAVIAVALAFPSVSRLHTSVPGNSGDSLLNLWIIRSVQTGLPRGWHALWNAGIFFFRGAPTPVCIEELPYPRRSNRVEWREGALTVVTGAGSRTSSVKTLERWLRRQARTAIQEQVATVATRLDVAPGRLYIMDQRTKWGNCSRMRNLSFNWRVIMAPDYVLRYLVTHETVHLATPDHSQKFWLTVQSICPETQRARQWLVANADRLLVDLAQALNPPHDGGSKPLAEGRADPVAEF
jgi:Protein of unknown function DUF45